MLSGKLLVSIRYLSVLIKVYIKKRYESIKHVGSESELTEGL